jgi:N-acetylglucosaminyldiphosphoundecaprenol N-acetyl-beta-D-mannosaminyltransferase
VNAPVSRRELVLVGRGVSLFDIPITDATYEEASDLLDSFVSRTDRPRAVHFANAHTFNQACRDPAYRAALRRADCVFGDGTGVRWAIRALHGRRLRANVNGTDLLPYFMRRADMRGHRLYLLGARDAVLERTVARLGAQFGGWKICGFHHGFFDTHEDQRVVSEINRSQPDMLLVAMGNPRQELWIARNQHRLDVPLSMGVGALFDYWAEVERRAPPWMRELGAEWVFRMLFHRGKVARYLVGNPEFLLRVMRAKLGHASPLEM